MKRGVYFFWSLFIAAALLRVVFSMFQMKAPDIGDCLKQDVGGTGIVTEEPAFSASGQTIVVEVDELKVGDTICPSGILVRMKAKLYPRFSYGNHVQFSGKLNEPFNFKSDTGRAFDYKGFLAKSDIYYEIKSAKVVLNTGLKKGNYASSILFRLKRGFVNNLETTLGEPHAALAAGLVVGEKAALGKDLLNDFRVVGLIHIVVLSGFNITIVADALRKMLSFLPRVWGITIGGMGIGLFGILVGGGATVVRSCFMSGVALSADLIRRDYNVTRALVFAGLLMLIQNPSILLHDPSFQLSFLATLGLILLAKPLEDRLTFIPEKFGLRGTIATTFATQIFVSPFILYMMGQISIIGVVVNILVLPFIPVTMLFVFLTGAIGFISFPLSQIIGWVAHFLLSYELFMVENFARMPYAAMYVPQFSGWWVAGFYAMFPVVYWRKEIFVAINSLLKLNNRVITPTTLQILFEEFQKLPNNFLIDNPNTSIITDFEMATEIQSFNLKGRSVVFTRRTLKHISEKKDEGKRLLDLLPRILKTPDYLFRGKGNRLLIVKSFNHGKKEEPHVVVIESLEKMVIIVTPFVTDKKYLKNFEILWRTGGSLS